LPETTTAWEFPPQRMGKIPTPDGPRGRYLGAGGKNAPSALTGSIRTGRRMGQGRVELPTSRLSGVRSNHLSYWPLADLKDKQRAEALQPATEPLPSGGGAPETLEVHHVHPAHAGTGPGDRNGRHR